MANIPSHARLPATPSIADRAGNRRRYAEMLTVGGLSIAMTLGGAALYGAATVETPKAGYGIAIFQDEDSDAGVGYRIEATRMTEVAEGNFANQTSVIGHFTCQWSDTDTSVRFHPDAATAQQADSFNTTLDPICSPHGALLTNADEAVIASLVGSGIIGSPPQN